MTKEEIDSFCKSCDKKRKQGECLLKSVCKDCKEFYDCVVFCIAEKRKANDKL